MTGRALALLGLVYLLAAFGLAVAALAIVKALEPPPALSAPIVQAAATNATFVCTPTIAPRLGRQVGRRTTGEIS